MKFCELVLELHLVQKNVKHTKAHIFQRDKSCSRYAKMCKYIKNWKSKIFMKPILCSIYIEESKNVSSGLEFHFSLGKEIPYQHL